MDRSAVSASQVVLVISSLLLILLVLLHKGKGGGLSDMFGGGMSSPALGGSSVAERNLDRFTVALGLRLVRLRSSALGSASSGS